MKNATLKILLVTLFISLLWGCKRRDIQKEMNSDVAGVEQTREMVLVFRNFIRDGTHEGLLEVLAKRGIRFDLSNASFVERFKLALYQVAAARTHTDITSGKPGNTAITVDTLTCFTNMLLGGLGVGAALQEPEKSKIPAQLLIAAATAANGVAACGRMLVENPRALSLIAKSPALMVATKGLETLQKAMTRYKIVGRSAWLQAGLAFNNAVSRGFQALPLEGLEAFHKYNGAVIATLNASSLMCESTGNKTCFLTTAMFALVDWVYKNEGFVDAKAIRVIREYAIENRLVENADRQGCEELVKNTPHHPNQNIAMRSLDEVFAGTLEMHAFLNFSACYFKHEAHWRTSSLQPFGKMARCMADQNGGKHHPSDAEFTNRTCDELVRAVKRLEALTGLRHY